MKKIFENIYRLVPASLQSRLISPYGYTLYRKRSTGFCRDIKKEIENVKQMRKREVEDYQYQQLVSMIRYCEDKILYYKNIFAKYGLNSSDIKNTEDPVKMPTLDKQTLRVNWRDFIPFKGVKVYVEQKTIVSTRLSWVKYDYLYKTTHLGGIVHTLESGS